MSTIYWLNNDLRIDDNPALLAAGQSDSLSLVYCVDPRWFETRRLQAPALGTHRWALLKEALEDLDSGLQSIGQRLLVLYEEPVFCLPRLAQTLAADELICSRSMSADQDRVLAEIGKRTPDLKIRQFESYTLFDETQLPFRIEDLPETYSRFRRKAEPIKLNSPLTPPRSLPPQPASAVPLVSDSLPATTEATQKQIRGGEQAANAHLSAYLCSELPLNYKEVRNELDGWDNSSKLSPWLNLGNISARRVVQQLRDFETRKGANESTYWLFIELLWREYFQWLSVKIGVDLFEFGGVNKRKPSTNFQSERFAAWCEGNTSYPLVNACMRQLLKNGYLSNRGRQIAASCLVNELQMDWRFGAAWFQYQLIDYDEAVNWGNWQYIAGVGADPRGGRNFNLAKQAELYDADGSYRKRWAGELSRLRSNGNTELAVIANANY